MKRTLLICMTALLTLSLWATPDSSTPGNEGSTVTGGTIANNIDINQFIDLIEHVEGHVFLSKGETRNLTNIVYFSDAIQPEGGQPELLNWTVANRAIADINYQTGEITAKEFGLTYVIAHNSLGEDFNIAVFVCPTITVHSPEGAIYTYQKIYNTPAYIQLTQSNEYLVNCVMNDDDDVTDQVNEDGTFQSEGPVRSDMHLTVSLEERIKDNEDGENVLGRSGLNLRVNPVKHTLEFYDPDNKIANKAKVTITDYDGNVRYNEPMPADKRITFLEGVQGVFNVKIAGIPGDFKIIMQ